MSTPFLLTGVTGGLGARILNDMLHVHKVPASTIIATSRSDSNKQGYEAQGLHFRVADYNRSDTLHAAFSNVENLLFMSSSERENVKRDREHLNVIEAAKARGVKRIWYVSLAFGGFGDGSKIGFQQSHYKTEDLLVQSGLDFITLRAGQYADAFPLYLNWYPSSKSVLFPNISPPLTESKIAFASRDELGEAMATLLVKGLAAFPIIKPQTTKNIILLTGPCVESAVDFVNAINRGRGTNIPINYLDPERWIQACAKDDEGGKTEAWFRARLTWMQGVCDGDAATIDPSMETLLGRRPEVGTETLVKLLKVDPDYTWHQNHVR